MKEISQDVPGPLPEQIRARGIADGTTEHDGPGGGAMCPRRIDGSLHVSPCSNTGSRKTATSPSTREEINTTEPVPLYLVPQAIASEVRKHGRAVSEVHVRRGGRHMYAITVVVQE